MVKRFEVHWRFIGERGKRAEHTSIVLARDKGHAKERVWMLHVGYGELRQQIEFLQIKEVE